MFEVPCANAGAFRSWVLGLLEHAEVLSPPAVRADVVEWLRATAAGRAVSRPVRRSAEERLRRLLVMLPWLMERGETPLSEVARHFDLTPEEVSADLELAAMCGLPPFVDELIDVFIDEDVVVVGVPRLFTRPLRLTAPEGFALVAAGRVAMQLPGAAPEGPLGRGLRKLAAALGDEAVAVDLPRPAGVDAVLDELTAAVRRVEQVEVRYWTASRDEVTERTITPRHIFGDHGDWYVVADDQRSGRAAHVPRRPHRGVAGDGRLRRARRRGVPSGPTVRPGSPTAACPR